MIVKVENAVVVITGASSGIGHAAALRFAERGARLVLVSRSASALAEVVREIEAAGGEAMAVPADVSRFEEVELIAHAAALRFGRIDVWVNNAAVAEWALIEDSSPADMRRVIEVDLLGAMYGVRAALPHLRRAGGGVIVNVASALSDRAIPLLSTYSAAKAGLKSFSDSLRMEMRATGTPVDVVTILPSSINTPFYRWGPSKLGVRPHAVSTIYPPKAVARAIVAAVEHPQREIFVGFTGKMLSVGERLSPRALDWYMLRRQHMFREQMSRVADRGQSNLFQSRGETAINGPFGKETRRMSFYTSLVSLHPFIRRAVAAGVVVAGIAMLVRSRASEK